jgi:hypothetical protein
VALRVADGFVRIENDRAADIGDIIVDTAAISGSDPVLSIRNGLRMVNAFLFTNHSTLQTELISRNFDGAENVQPALELGHLSLRNPDRDMVRIRADVEVFADGTISKGDRFQLIRASSFNYSASRVFPVDFDGQGKAPFDPFISNVLKYFQATHNIDFPMIGAPSVTNVLPGAVFAISFPVTTETGLKPGSATLGGELPSGSTVVISGSHLMVQGVAPELLDGQDSLTLNYRVSVTSNEDVPTDTIGYVGYRNAVLVVSTEPITPPEPQDPVLTGTMSHDAGATVEPEEEITFVVGPWTYTDEDGVEFEDVPVVYGAPQVEGDATVDTAVVDDMFVVVVDEDAEPGSTITVSVSATYADLSRTLTSTLTVYDPDGPNGPTPTPTPTPPSNGRSSSSGCSTGFAGAGLVLFLAVPLFFSKKD